MNNSLEHALTSGLEQSLNKTDCIEAARFRSFDGELIISLNIYTFKWLLQVNKKLEYWDYIFNEVDGEQKENDIVYYRENNFSDLALVLDKLIQTDYEYEMMHDAKRWWSFLPAWAYLEIEYMNPVFIKYFKNNIQDSIDGIESENFSKGEKKTLSQWLG